MSYAFKITKDADGVRLEDVSPEMLEHIPAGTFTVSGHAVTGEPGWSDTETITIALAEGDRFIISAQASGKTRKAGDSQ